MENSSKGTVTSENFFDVFSVPILSSTSNYTVSNIEPLHKNLKCANPNYTGIPATSNLTHVPRDSVAPIREA